MVASRIGRRILAALLGLFVIACSETNHPVAVPPAGEPSTNTMVGTANTVTTWIDGGAFTLDTLAHRLYYGDTVILLDAEMSAVVLTDMRGIQVTDRDAEQLETIYYEYEYERNGQCIITNTCPEPMFLPGEPLELATASASDGVIIEWVGPVPGSPRKPVVQRRMPGPRSRTGDIAALSTGDLCTQTVENAIAKARQHQTTRGRFLRALTEFAVVTVAGKFVEKVIPYAYLVGAYDIAAQESFRYLDLNVMSWFWYTYGCNTREYFIGDAADNRQRPTQRNGSGGGIDDHYMWQCRWEMWTLDFGETQKAVNVRVCGYVYVE